jgi:hypothetical protein
VPKPDRRRALELLARCGAEGCTEALMLANDFTVDMLVELVRGGLASAESASGRPAIASPLALTRHDQPLQSWKPFHFSKAQSANAQAQ